MSSVLQDKKIPKDKLIGAVVTGTLIVATAIAMLTFVTYECMPAVLVHCCLMHANQ